MTKLAGLIDQKNEIERQASVQLTMLFWETGNLMANADENLKDKNLAAALSKTYGPFFAQKQLQTMKELVSFVPTKEALAKFVNIMGWQHLEVLLSVKDNRLRQQFLAHKISEGLTVAALRKLIVTNPQGFKRKSVRMPTISFDVFTKNVAAMPALFKSPMLERYQLLMSKKGLSEREKAHELVNQINNTIQNFRDAQNAEISASITKLFWKTGRYIQAENDSAINTTQLVKKAKLVEAFKRSGIRFTANDLQAMRMFAQLVTKEEDAAIIASSVTWEQLVVLLTLNDKEKIVSACAYLFRKKMSAREVSAFIKEELPNIKTKPDHKVAMNTVVKKEKKNAVSGVTYFDVPDKYPELFYPDVLKSKSFLKLF